MKKVIIISTLALFAALACTPVSITGGAVPPENSQTPSQDGSDNQDGSGTPDTGNQDSTGNHDNSNPDGNYTPEISTDENGYDGLTATDGDADAVISGDETYWENKTYPSTVTVSYSGNTATVTAEGNAVKHYVSGADVTIDLTDAGAAEIIASGQSEDGQLKVYGNSAVKLTLKGLALTSCKSAAINVQSKALLYLHLADGTTNIISDAQTQSDESYYPDGVAAADEKRNGAIYCKGSLVLSGSGILSITGKNKHGISVKSAFTQRPGVTLAINDVKDNCIKADGITVLGGYLWAKTSADAGKCLSSDADVNIKGGLMKLYTSGGSIYEDNDTSSPAGIKADGNISIYDGELLCVSTGLGGKGLSADGSLLMEGGTVNAITSGGKYVYSTALDLDSSPKGVKADGEIVINGGLLNIQVTGMSDGSEGLESKTKITVNAGEVFVYAYDDAINAGGDNPQGMEINGGKVFAYSDHGDGIDSNGKLWVNGGLVIASGSSSPEEGLDCDNSQNFIVTGGTLIGTGGAAIQTSGSSTQRSVIYNGIKAETGELVVIADAAGEPILRYKFPRTISSLALFFSSPAITANETYTVYSGGSLSGNSGGWNGWYDDGTYTAGTVLGNFTSGSLTTVVGQSNGPGGGGHGGGTGPGGGGPGWWH